MSYFSVKKKFKIYFSGSFNMIVKLRDHRNQVMEIFLHFLTLNHQLIEEKQITFLFLQKLINNKMDGFNLFSKIKIKLKAKDTNNNNLFYVTNYVLKFIKVFI